MFFLILFFSKLLQLTINSLHKKNYFKFMLILFFSFPNYQSEYNNYNHRVFSTKQLISFCTSATSLQIFFIFKFNFELVDLFYNYLFPFLGNIVNHSIKSIVH